MKLSAVILAGGESRRMGRDKAWVETGGQPLVVRALSTIRDAGIEEVFISGRAGSDYSGLGCAVIFDREPGSGPVAGIERALEAATAPLTLVLAVDMPRMTAGFLRKLSQHCGHLTGVIPKLAGHLEPLAAIYPQRCGCIARNCQLKGQRAARGFAEACLRERAIETFVVPPADAICFDNWNRPSDLFAADLARS